MYYGQCGNAELCNYLHFNIVEPLVSGHPWGQKKCPLKNMNRAGSVNMIT